MENGEDTCTSSYFSPPSMGLSRKEFLKWREAHPLASHTLAYEGHRVKLHSGLNSPHISAVSEELTNRFASKEETAVERRRRSEEEVIQEGERPWPSPFSSSSSFHRIPPSSSSIAPLSVAACPSSTAFSPTSERSVSPPSTLSSPCHAIDALPSATPFVSPTPPSLVCAAASLPTWNGGKRKRSIQSTTLHTTTTTTSTILPHRSIDAPCHRPPPPPTPVVHTPPISPSMSPDRMDATTEGKGGGGGGGVVSTFLDQVQQFQRHQSSHLRHRLGRERKKEYLNGEEKQVTERHTVDDKEKSSSAQKNAVNMPECSFVRKDERETCGRKNEPCSTSVKEKGKNIDSDPASSSLLTCKVHRAPFFAQDETGRLAAFTAGKRSGPSVASLDSPVYHRKGEWKGKALGMLLQRENPEAPWQAMGSLRQKIEEAQKELFILNLSSHSSSVMKVQSKHSHHSKKNNTAFSTMSRKDKEAYLRYAGRLTSSFEQFEGEVTCTKYMTEIRQAKTIRSREQMHFNATSKINYRSMPKGLWKEYGSSNMTDPRGCDKRNADGARSGALSGSSSAGTPCGSREEFHSNERPSFSSSRVLGC